MSSRKDLEGDRVVGASASAAITTGFNVTSTDIVMFYLVAKRAV